MIENKFFNNSATTNSGRPKFVPPQKRQQVQEGIVPVTTENHQFKKVVSDKSSNVNTFNSFKSQESQPKVFSFKRNCTSLLTPWGSRHLRTGFIEKSVEEEEKALFNIQNKNNSNNNGNANNYDDLEVELINKSNVDAPNAVEKFEELNLSPHLSNNISQVGYQKLTVIQRCTIPIIKNKINLLACSQTGSGKTASFLIPIIQDLIQSGVPNPDVPVEQLKQSRISQCGSNVLERKAYPIVLIMAPTRELALQIYQESRKFCYLTGILTKVIYGGKESYEQHQSLTLDGCDILVATPGRLIDFLDKYISLSMTRFVVLDEADRMLDMGFEPQIRDIMKRITQQRNEDKNLHISMFSATFPKQVKSIVDEYLKSYIHIAVGNQGKLGSINNSITQELIDVRNQDKDSILFDLISKVEGKLIVFCATKKTVFSVYNYLSSKNLFVAQTHGDLDQNEREVELQLFKDKCSILIATDVASRGLDIPDVAFVINYDLPTNIESYIHRIGRTGRIGKVGTAISFVDFADERIYQKLYKLLLDSKQEVPRWFEVLVRRKQENRDYDRNSKVSSYDEEEPNIRERSHAQVRFLRGMQRGYSDSTYTKDVNHNDFNAVLTYDC